MKRDSLGGSEKIFHPATSHLRLWRPLPVHAGEDDCARPGGGHPPPPHRAERTRRTQCAECWNAAVGSCGSVSQCQSLMATSLGEGEPVPVSTSALRLSRKTAHLVLQWERNSTGSAHPSCVNSTMV